MQRTENLELAIIESNDPFNYTALNENSRKIDAFATSGSFPSGGIIIWSGSSSNIPTGWALCNGENNTPDLRDRFVLGAGNNYSVGNTGGEKEHKLTVDEMPSHSHTFENHRGSTYIGSYNAGTNQVEKQGTLTTSSTGGSSPHNNMPPYYALCYIMKL